MKRFLLLFTLALFSLSAWAQIAYVGGGTQTANCTGGTLGTQICVLTASPPNGDFILLFVKEANPPQTPWCTDSNFRTLTPGNSQITLNGDSLEVFGMIVTGSPTSFTCNGMGSGVNSMAGVWYSGALSLNMLMAGGSGLGATCTGGGCASLTPTLDDANDYAVCAFGDSSTTFTTPYTGTLRQAVTVNPTLAIVDGTSSSTGPITVAASMTSSTAWKGVCAELRTVSSSSTYILLQYNPVIPNTYTGHPANCSESAVSCTWPIAPTQAGTLLVLSFVDHADSFSGGEPQRTIVSVADCASLTSGICASSIDTFVLGSSLCPGATCPEAYVIDSASGSQSVDAAFVLSGAGGANWITAVRSGVASNPPAEPGRYALAEVLPASGSFALDNVGTATVFTKNTTFNMTGVTTCCTNEVIFQGFAGAQQPMLITAPYYYGQSTQGHMGFWGALGVSSPTTPTITAYGLQYGAAGNALAFKNTSSGPSVSAMTAGTKLTPGTRVTP